jgi:hypothetical protein
LGFARNAAEKALIQIVREHGKEKGVEHLIKLALKIL